VFSTSSLAGNVSYKPENVEMGYSAFLLVHCTPIPTFAQVEIHIKIRDFPQETPRMKTVIFMCSTNQVQVYSVLSRGYEVSLRAAKGGATKPRILKMNETLVSCIFQRRHFNRP
jgi:hypothetical protein